MVKWLLIALAACVLVLGGAVSAAALMAKQFRDSEQIAANVSIVGVPVGGLSVPEATQEVLRGWAANLPQRVRLRWLHGSAQPSPEQLGARLRIDQAVEAAHQIGRQGSFITQIIDRVKLSRSGIDVPVPSEVDEEAVEAYLVDLAAKVNREPRNADFEVVGDDVHVVPGEVGVQLDIAASTHDLAAAMQDPSLRTFDLVTKLQPPAISAEDLQHLEVVLASYSTKFKPWQTDRTHNLGMAIANLSRAVVDPGATLSFNERVGPRLSEAGWRAAPIFINGEVEPSTGGGICQVASTVYNAALLANLDIVERHHHSRPVDYVPPGRDATVYWGQYDLKFKNTLRHPALLIGDISDNTLTIRILGSREDKTDVTIASSAVQWLDFETKEQPDPELELDKRETEKEGRKGARVTIHRTAARGGEIVRKERLHTDVYSPQAEVIKVGAKLPEDVLGEGGALTPGTEGAVPGAARPEGPSAAPVRPPHTSLTPAPHGATPPPAG